MLLHVTMEQDEDGFVVAECPALPGCVSQGKDEQEAHVNIKEAIEAWLWAEEKNTPAPISGIDTAIGKRLANARKERGFSQEALAKEMGISRKQVVDYETGRVHLNDEMIIRFAVTLNVSADELLGLKVVKSSSDSPALRITRRFRDLEKLPEDKKRAVLKVLDELIRANS